MTPQRTTGRTARRLTVAILVALGCAGACDGGGGTDSNTNWLEPCGDDDDCGSLQCLCGRCSKPCTSVGDCSGLTGAICGPNGPECGCSLPSDAGTPDASTGGSTGPGGVSGGGNAGTGNAGVGGTTSSGDSSAGGASAGGDGSSSADASSGGAPDPDAGLDGGHDASTLPPGPNPLDFSFPTAHSMTDADGMRVSGIIDSVTNVVSVSVNGVAAESLEGSFARWRTTTDVPLAPGKNTLQVIAERSAGPALTLKGTVWRKPADALDRLLPQSLVGDFGGLYDVHGFLQSFKPLGLARDSAKGLWLFPFPVLDFSVGLGSIDESGEWGGAHIDAERNNAWVTADSNGGHYFSHVVSPGGIGVPSEIVDLSALISTIHPTGEPKRIWFNPFTGPAPFRFAIDSPRSRLLAVQESPLALVSIDSTTGASIVLSDETHGSGPLFTPGAAIVAAGATLALLPGCEGAMVVDLTTGDRTSWGSTNSGPCKVAEGTYNGGAVVLEQLPGPDGGTSAVERWQVRFVDPVARTISTWFDITVPGALAAASVDPDGGRLALAFSGAFTVEAYDLPGGEGPRAVAFGTGPMASNFRFHLPYDTAVRQDGHLLVQHGELSVDPNSGIRRRVFPPVLDGTFRALYPDPLTGEMIAITAQGTYRLASDFSSNVRLGDSVSPPLGLIGSSLAAYDAVGRKLYGVGDNVVNVLDVATGALQTIPGASNDLRRLADCGLLHSSVSRGQGALYIESFNPGFSLDDPLCGCFKFEFATGNVTPFACVPAETRDGRLLMAPTWPNGGEWAVSSVDPVTGTPTPFSRAPDLGRGYPLPAHLRSSLAIDPRRDRIWASVVQDSVVNRATPQRYFVIDPFNGDRALVSN